MAKINMKLINVKRIKKLTEDYSLLFSDDIKADKVLIDPDYNLILPHEYIRTLFINGGFIGVKSKKWNIVDIDNNFLMGPFDNIKTFYKKENYYRNLPYMRVKKNGLWGLVSSNLETVIDFKYKYIGLVFDNMFICRGKNFVHVYNLAMQKIYECKEAYPAGSGLYAVKADKWGYINFSGNLIIPHIYEEVSPFESDLASVTKNNSTYKIDPDGNKVTAKVLYLNR